MQLRITVKAKLLPMYRQHRCIASPLISNPPSTPPYLAPHDAVGLLQYLFVVRDALESLSNDYGPEFVALTVQHLLAPTGGSALVVEKVARLLRQPAPFALRRAIHHPVRQAERPGAGDLRRTRPNTRRGAKTPSAGPTSCAGRGTFRRAGGCLMPLRAAEWLST